MDIDQATRRDSAINTQKSKHKVVREMCDLDSAMGLRSIMPISSDSLAFSCTPVSLPTSLS